MDECLLDYCNVGFKGDLMLIGLLQYGVQGRFYIYDFMVYR